MNPRGRGASNSPHNSVWPTERLPDFSAISTTPRDAVRDEKARIYVERMIRRRKARELAGLSPTPEQSL